MTTLDDDNYGRTVTCEDTNTETIYTIINPDSSIAFTLGLPRGWSLPNVYSAINALAPG